MTAASVTSPRAEAVGFPAPVRRSSSWSGPVEASSQLRSAVSGWAASSVESAAICVRPALRAASREVAYATESSFRAWK
ncbi:hypothetical protein GCM10010326_33190 [Streptomyces xanthochromogenes]|uniref:Uncharacterized protein n=1 Tax=Streptomyces xanthochromogenes TaxID=67384 RepID=A0ABQ3A9A8_9ACTN|nr:hypothetical protein GCM10010326_33190 [Streptomyces xanthochromogenes]